VAAVRIENRAQLIYLLTEAAEIEHNVLCAYLFAQFTMKNDPSEGLTPKQLASVHRWRGAIRQIVVQEMLHLASACNLLTAVGGAPQLRRPNLPTSPRAYPKAFELRLVPFGPAALDQFVFLERPEYAESSGHPGASYREASLAVSSLRDAFSREREYETLGELYRGIEDGLSYLTQKLGEEKLFIGRPEAQTADSFFRLPGLAPIHNLQSSLAALNVIVEQGEGASPDSPDSHYRRFLRMRDEFRDLVAEDGNFEPGRPVVTNPYALMPGDVAAGSEIALLDGPLSVDMSSLFDGCYEIMVQMLGRLFVHAEETGVELQALAEISVGLMADVLEPLGSAISLLPAGPSHPGLNAGPSFRLSRGASIPTQKDAARFVFHERMSELAAYCRFLPAASGAPPALAGVREALDRFARRLADLDS
jgi:Ferritin-like